MRDEEGEAGFRRDLERDPGCNSARLAKQHGLSNRAASRVIQEMATANGRKSGRRRVAGAGIVLSICGGAALTWSRTDDPPGPRAPRDTAVVALERDLYRALDARDPARVAEASRQLASEDDSLRLAALRYLVVNDESTEHRPAMLALLADPSDRVRPAAIQLMAGVPGAEVDERLLDLLLDPGRPQSERLLACASLERRAVTDRASAAQRALPALLDPSAAIREVTQRLLRGLTGKTLAVGTTNVDDLHAAWRQALAS